MTKRRFAGRSTGLISRFGSNRKGNVAIIFAFACIPIMTAIGCAVDYSLAVRMRSKMQAAADAASVGAIAQSSPGYAAAELMVSNGSVPIAVTDATNIFNGNMNLVGGFSGLTVTATVTKTNSTLTSVTAFSANVPTTFLKVIGYTTLGISGTSTSSASLPLYLDFYLMLDVSGSMGLPSTAAEQTRLSAVNPDNYSNYPTGCTFACHFGTQNDACPNGVQKFGTNNYCMGYPFSRVSQAALTTLLNRNSTVSVPKTKPGLPNSMLSGLPNSLNTDPTFGMAAAANCPTDGTDACIQLRADAVGYAVNQLLITANNTQKVANQFRIGLYPFIQYLYAYSSLTSSINGSPTTPGTINYAAANLASQLDTNMNSNLGSGGTHFENAFPSMSTLITSVGNGSSSISTLPYVFLVTDGAEDPQTKGINGGGWSGSNHATTLNPATLCTPLKNRGITIAVLYIPYQPISPVNSAFAGDEDDAANNNIPNIPPSLQACASTNFFFTANTPADIATALNAMFNKALVTAHITN